MTHVFSFFDRGSNSRALKVAGLTTLACLLLASQVFTAYMVFGQKQQISQLQSKSDNMAKDIHRSSRGNAKRSVSLLSNCLHQTERSCRNAELKGKVIAHFMKLDLKARQRNEILAGDV